jgi:hypothetical protein
LPESEKSPVSETEAPMTSGLPESPEFWLAPVPPEPGRAAGHQHGRYCNGSYRV